MLDYGAYYAQKTAGDAYQPNRGRRVIFAFTGWAERKGGQLNRACGISHLMPRDLSLDAAGRVLVRPVPEISRLRDGAAQTLAVNGAAVTMGSQVMANLFCTGVQVGKRGVPFSVGLDLLLDAQGGEWTRVGLDLDSGALFVDQSHTNAHDSSLSNVVQRTAPLQSVAGAAETTLNLTVLVDGGLMETYANDRVVISSLLSPSASGTSGAEARQARAFTTGAGPMCVAQAWRLRAVPSLKTEDVYALRGRLYFSSQTSNAAMPSSSRTVPRYGFALSGCRYRGVERRGER